MQFLECFSPGMEIAKNTYQTFPYGWSSLSEFCKKNNIETGEFHLVKMKENGTGITKTFIGFPNISISVGFVAWFISNKRKGRFGYWYSLNEDDALRYEKSLQKTKAVLIK